VLSPSRFRFRYPIDVRFRDLDAIGHVNNAVFLTYFEQARIAWWLHVTQRNTLRDLDMILARVEIDYRSPIVFGESIEVGVGCTSLGRSSFVVEEDAHERERGRLVAACRKTLVYYDFAKGRKQELTPAIRELLLAQDPEAATR
jgi:acyl-CoA thioester hydrolase